MCTIFRMEKDKFGGQRLKKKFMWNYVECKNVEGGAAFWTKCCCCEFPITGQNENNKTLFKHSMALY